MALIGPVLVMDPDGPTGLKIGKDSSGRAHLGLSWQLMALTRSSWVRCGSWNPHPVQELSCNVMA